MNILAVCSAGVVASVLAVVLKKQNAEYSFILSVCACSLVLVYVISNVLLTVDEVKEMFESYSINSEYILIMLKCVGVCFLAEFSSDCCKDAGQAALSGVVLVGGRLFVVLTALPLFSQLLTLVSKLSGGEA